MTLRAMLPLLEPRGGVPLIVGVAGERDVRPGDETALRAAFGGILGELRSRYPASPLAVLTTQAGDASRMAADEARARSVAVVVADLSLEQVACSSHLIVAFADDAPAARADPEERPLFTIVPPHPERALPAVPWSVRREYPARYASDTSAQRDFEAALRRFDTYNADLARAAPADAPSGLASLMERTDAVAGALQRTTLRFARALYVCAFAAAAAQIAFGDQRLRLALLGLAFGAYLLARRFDYENRHQDYRALAEGLRVQDAWCSAG